VVRLPRGKSLYGRYSLSQEGRALHFLLSGWSNCAIQNEAGDYYDLRHQRGWLLILECGVGVQETTEDMAF